jgi:hypothetical protein
MSHHTLALTVRSRVRGRQHRPGSERNPRLGNQDASKPAGSRPAQSIVSTRLARAVKARRRHVGGSASPAYDGPLPTRSTHHLTWDVDNFVDNRVDVKEV